MSAGVRSSPAATAMVLRVTSANRSVGAVSKTGTTTERSPVRTLNRSIAASRRWYGTGFRFVFSWLAEVTAQTIVRGAVVGESSQVIGLKTGQQVMAPREQDEAGWLLNLDHPALGRPCVALWR